MRTFIYKDTPLNRNLNRVGQPYFRKSHGQSISQIGGLSEISANYALRVLLENWSQGTPWYWSPYGKAIVDAPNDRAFESQLLTLFEFSPALIVKAETLLGQFPNIAPQIEKVIDNFLEAYM